MGLSRFPPSQTGHRVRLSNHDLVPDIALLSSPGIDGDEEARACCSRLSD